MNSWLKYITDNRMEPTHAIIGIDPGDTVGVFVCLIHADGVILDAHQINSDAIYPWLSTLTSVLTECGVPANRRHFAIEKYQITRRTVKLTRQPTAIEVTGVAKAIAKEWGAHAWEFGMATSKKLASDDLLERVDWFPKSRRRGMRHARDAARQTWACLMEVDFPTWESSYERVNDVRLGGGEDDMLESIAEIVAKIVLSEHEEMKRDN